MKTTEDIRAIIEELKILYPQDDLCSLPYEKDYELLFASEKQIFVSLLFPLRVKVPLKYSPASFVPRYATNSPKAIRKIPLDSRCPYSCRSRSRYSPRSRNSRDNKGRPSDKDRNSSAFL